MPYFREEQTLHEEEYIRLAQEVYSKNNLQEGAKLRLSNKNILIGEKTAEKTVFYIIKNELGRGTFGKVYTACRIEVRLSDEESKSDSSPDLEIFIKPNMVVKSVKCFQEDKADIVNEVLIQQKFLWTEVFCNSFEDSQGRDCIESFICMEQVPGENLYNYQEMAHMLLSDRMNLICQCISQIHEMHNNTCYSGLPIIHGDLKPQNVMVDTISLVSEESKSSDDEALAEEARLQIIDFGYSLSAEGISAPNMLLLHHTYGNPYYFPPETVKGASAGFKTDIFMIVPVLSELLGTRNPLASKDQAFKPESIHLLSASGKLQLSSMPFDIDLRNTFSANLIEKYDLAFVVEQFLNKMQAADYMERPDIDEVLRFFTLVSNIVCFEENIDKLPLNIQFKKHCKYLEELNSYNLNLPLNTRVYNEEHLRYIYKMDLSNLNSIAKRERLIYLVGEIEKYLLMIKLNPRDPYLGKLKEAINLIEKLVEIECQLDLSRDKLWIEHINLLQKLYVLSENRESALAERIYSVYENYKVEFRSLCNVQVLANDKLNTIYNLSRIVDTFCDDLIRSGNVNTFIKVIRTVENIIDFENSIENKSLEDILNTRKAHLLKLQDLIGIDLNPQILDLDKLDTFKLKYHAAYNNSWNFFKRSNMKKEWNQFQTFSQVESLIQSDQSRFGRSRDIIATMQ